VVDAREPVEEITEAILGRLRPLLGSAVRRTDKAKA